MKLLPIAERRPSPAAMTLPQLFARQSTDCSSGAFYRCALNNFAGCCSVDPCALDDGCPDDEDEPDEDEPDEDEKEEPSSSEKEKTASSTTHEEKTTTVAKTRIATATVTLTNDNGDVTSVVTRVETGASLPTNLAEADGNIPDSSSDSDDSGGLSAAAITGIAVGIVALLLAALLFYRRRRRRAAAAQATHEAYPAHTPTDEKFLSAATTPAGGFAGKFGSRAPTPSTPGMSDGNGRYSYVSSMTASPPPGSAGFPRGAGELPPHPGIAQLDAEPMARIAEMDAGAARPSELPASPIGGAGAPARGLGLGSARQGQQGLGQGQGQGGQLPTVAEVEPGLRGTLNPTEGERSQQTYVTSWSEFGGKQVGGNGGT